MAFFGGQPILQHEEVLEEGRLTGDERRRHGHASGGRTRSGADSVRGRGRGQAVLVVLVALEALVALAVLAVLVVLEVLVALLALVRVVPVVW